MPKLVSFQSLLESHGSTQQSAQQRASQVAQGGSGRPMSSTTPSSSGFTFPNLSESLKSFGSPYAASPPPMAKPARLMPFGLGDLMKTVQGWWELIASNSARGAAASQTLILTPEQKRWLDNIEQYAESPFEKSLFGLKKKEGTFNISFAWADALKGKDGLNREAALSLLKSYLTYASQDSLEDLSPHTQMKLMLFSTHLNEGLVGKAVLYHALASVPLEALLELQHHIIQDLSKLPSVAQAVILKEYLKRMRELENKDRAKKEDIKAFKQLVKQLVISFYASQHDKLFPDLKQQEKIKLGFLKFQPIQQDFAKSLEDIEKQYRVRLRKLKNRKKLKVAEAEDVKRRRIDLIYETIERDLMVGLEQVNLSLDQLVAV